MTTYILLAIAALILIIIIVLLWQKNRKDQNRITAISDELNKANIDNAILETQLNSVLLKQHEVEDQKQQLLSEFNKERTQISEQFTAKFDVLANEILDKKSRTIHTQNSDAIMALLRPFGEKIDQFKTRIEQESKERFALGKEVARLSELNLQMSQEANNLTSALKGGSKTQGDWGEMILETLLENSGLKRGIHFRTQESLKDENERILRPDIIVSMPDKKEIVIDSKVSLTAYVAYCEAADDEAAKKALANHVTSVRNHITELGRKSYQDLASSPDFVIMFVPNEPAFLLALQNQNHLWQEAYKKKVVLSSPTNLFAILRIVDDLWRRDSQSKNAMKIAQQGGELYDKFMGFVDTFSDIGKSIKRTEEQYEKGLKQLSEGRGNLIRRAENIRKLGVKTEKELPTQLVYTDDEDDEDEMLLVEDNS